MLSRTALFAAAGLLASVISIAWARPDPSAATLEMVADGEVQIANDGHVSDYRLHSKLAPDIAAMVDRAVHGWHFEPIMVAGAPAVAKTAMRLRLKAEPITGTSDYRVQISTIDFGEPIHSSQNKAPHYPEQAVHARLGAKVLLSVRLDDSGKVIDVQPYQTSLDARAPSAHAADEWRQIFEKASVAAARTWHYDLTETINGKPIGTNAMVPVVFAINGPGTVRQGTWKAYLPGPVHPASWMHSAQLADNRGLSALDDDHALSLDSHFQLKDDVIGKAL